MPATDPLIDERVSIISCCVGGVSCASEGEGGERGDGLGEGGGVIPKNAETISVTPLHGFQAGQRRTPGRRKDSRDLSIGPVSKALL